jgi:LysR family transcriptional regulator, chromosome initiation inhibitor
VQPLLDSGEFVNLLPNFALPVQLYWHCWNLQSDVLDSLTGALTEIAKRQLR